MRPSGFRGLVGMGVPFLLTCLLLNCTAKLAVKETAHYKLYENITLEELGHWVKTNIPVPEGAIVAIMAQGEMRNFSGTRSWQPFQVLRFKVGKNGPQNRIIGGPQYKTNPMNLNNIKTGKEGFLYFHVNARGYAQSRTSDMTATVIVWDTDHQGKIEDDIMQLSPSHLSRHQVKFLKILMARTFTESGDYERAESLSEPRQFLNRSRHEYWLGKYDDAKVHAMRARAFHQRRGNKHVEGIALILLARAVSALGQIEEAIELSKQALEIGKDTRNKYVLGLSHFCLGYNYLRMNQLNVALKHLKAAQKYFDQRGIPELMPESYLYIGKVQMKLNRQGEAKESFETAIKKAEALAKPEPIWMAHSRLGRIAENKGDKQEAFEHYAEAIEVIEGMRGKLSDPGLKALFMENKLYVYEWMIQLLKNMQRDAEALHYLERAKARAMLDMLGEKILFSAVNEESELLTQERDLRKRIDKLSVALRTVSPESQRKPHEQVGELKRLKNEHRRVLDSLEKLNPELASLVSINPLKANEIQQLLDQDTALLEYFLGKDMLLVFVVTRDKVHAVPLQGSTEALFELIQGFREQVVEEISLRRLDTKDYHKLLSDLYDNLIQPIEGEISDRKHLVIVPHGVLHYLPFQALCTTRDGKERYLIESYAISYLPSASVLRYARAKNKENRDNIFAVGNPTTGLAALPGAEKEAREVSAFFENKLVLTGQEATETLVKAQSPKYDMMLLSTHGEMIEDEPLKSNLRFAPSAADDGRLTVDEIFDMELKANLVTLSACETALVRGEDGGFPQGDDLIGLTRAFIHAGAPSAVASLWKVADDSTVKLMRTFYRNMESMPKAEALRMAQLELMKSNLKFTVERGGRGITLSPGYKPGLTIDWSHPFFWAPFVLVGDWK